MPLPLRQSRSPLCRPRSTYKDGTTTTVYSDNMSDTRSVAQVAYNMTQSEGGQAELNRLGETIKAMIEGWATKYNANQAQ